MFCPFCQAEATKVIDSQRLLQMDHKLEEEESVKFVMQDLPHLK